MADLNGKKEPTFDPMTPGMLAGWTIIGFFCGIFGALLVWFICRKFDGSKKTTPIMFALVGWGLSMFINIIVMFVTGVSIFDVVGPGASVSVQSSVW